MVPATTFASATVITLVELSGELAASTSGVTLVLRSNPTTFAFYASHGDGSNHTLPGGFDLPRGQWLHLTLELRFGAAGYLLVGVAGQPTVNQPLVTRVPAVPELRVGVQHYSGPTPAFAVLYDTVRVYLL